MFIVVVSAGGVRHVETPPCCAYGHGCLGVLVVVTHGCTTLLVIAASIYMYRTGMFGAALCPSKEKYIYTYIVVIYFLRLSK